MENVRTPEGRNATRRFKNHKFEASSIYSYLNTTTSELPSIIPLGLFPDCRCLSPPDSRFEVKRFEGNSMGKNVVCFYCVYVWVYVNCYDLFFGIGLE